VFDLRYHVASLAAVFFALVVGILVGVALASHGLGDSERKTLRRDLTDARNQADLLRQAVAELQDENAAGNAFLKSAYPAVMDGRLEGRRIAVLFVGSVDGKLRAAIKKTLADAGTEQTRVLAVKVPIVTKAVAKSLQTRPVLAAYAGKRQVKLLGQALGHEFTEGGDTPLWNALDSIIEETAGARTSPADGVLLVRTAPPQTGDTMRFLRGLYTGISDAGIPVVGVESTRESGASIKTFQLAGLSTVDDVDTQVGKLALAVLLSDPTITGNYGTKDTADGPLPDVTLAPVTTTTSG